MADVDIDPFGEHELRTDETGCESISLTPVGGGSTWDSSGVPGPAGPWEPERELETSFGELSGARMRCNAGFVEDKLNGLYEILSEYFPKNQAVIYCDDFESIRGELYFKGRDKPLMRKGLLNHINP